MYEILKIFTNSDACNYLRLIALDLRDEENNDPRKRRGDKEINDKWNFRWATCFASVRIGIKNSKSKNVTIAVNCFVDVLEFVKDQLPFAE